MKFMRSSWKFNECIGECEKNKYPTKVRTDTTKDLMAIVARRIAIARFVILAFVNM
jgi:hypothetical protein